ncbi:FAD-binding protein, partial [Acinetobacter baumannii]
LFATAVQLGVGVSYDTALAGLHVEPGHCLVELRRDGSLTRITARAVVVATGGDQADRAALRRQLGDAADTVVVRGTPHADGSGL